MTKTIEKGRIVLGDNMRAKDKKNNHIKVTIKRAITFWACIIIILYGIILYDHYLVKNEVYAKETSVKVIDGDDGKISRA